MINLFDVTKTYRSNWKLGPISLSLEKEKTHVLVGSSGCGKSTLLKLILGILTPDSGKIVLDGTDSRTIEKRTLAHKIGHVPQESGLFPHLTVRENVTLVARILKWNKDLIEHRIEELCRLTELGPAHMAAYPQQLSGGQRQRAGLVRALMLDPQFLLLDEPLGALDPIMRMSLQDQLQDIFKNLNKTVIIVTHDLLEAAFFADSVTLMKDGKVMQHGTFSDLLHRPSNEFVTEFLRAHRTPSQMELT